MLENSSFTFKLYLDQFLKNSVSKNHNMNNRLLKQLMRPKTDFKRKYKSLKAEIVNSQSHFIEKPPKHFIINSTWGSEYYNFDKYFNKYALQIKHERPLPVMFWIYGGGFANGYATFNMYGPHYILEHEVILVSVNYRVGPFGKI